MAAFRPAPHLRQVRAGGRQCGPGRVGGGALEPAVRGVQPPDHRVEPEQLGIHHQRQAEVVVGLGLLDPGPLLHELDQIPAMDLDDLMHVGAGHPERHQHLHHQLVPRRGGQVRRGTQPRGQLGQALAGDPEGLLRAVLRLVVGLDQPVPLQPLQRRVHLADVERPDFAGARLEFLAELQPVLRPLAEQRQQRMPDAHVGIPFSSMPGIILGI